MKILGERRGLTCLAMISFLAGGFFLGCGAGSMIWNIRLRNAYENSRLEWKRELAAGFEAEEIRDRYHQELARNMEEVSIRRELHLQEGEPRCKADIEVGELTDYGCSISIIRDATGELLYESGLIEPFHSIEIIPLKGSLKAGYYPCTAVWSFFADNGEYMGMAAWKIVLIISR